MRFTIFVLLLFAGGVSAAKESRFSGSAALGPVMPASADARFTLDASLVRADHIDNASRFALRANLGLSAEAKSVATACGAAGVILFSNGFEG